MFSPQRHSPDVGHVDVRDLYALVRHHGQQQTAGAAVDVVARHDVLAGLHQAHHRDQRRHAAREGKTPVRALSSTRSTWFCSPAHCTDLALSGSCVRLRRWMAVRRVQDV